MLGECWISPSTLRWMYEQRQKYRKGTRSRELEVERRGRHAAREFLRIAGGGVVGAGLPAIAKGATPAAGSNDAAPRTLADHTIRIGTGLVEVGPQRFLSMTTYNGCFSGAAAPPQGKPAGRRRHPQRHRHAGAVALARPAPPRFGRRCGRGGDAVHPRARHAARGVRTRPRRASFYHTHLRAGGDLHAWPVQRPGGAGLHRAGARARGLRPRGVPDAEGVRPVLQPGR